MKRQSLHLLSCPACRSRKKLQASSDGDVVETGLITCPSCLNIYPVERGIVHFIQQEKLVGFNKKLTRMYDWFSWIYGAYSRVGLFLLGTTETRARSELVARLEARGRVLEVSIGPGVNLPFLCEVPAVDEIHGLDISIGQLNRCIALLSRKHWPVDLYLGNAEQLPFIDNSFDTVFHLGGINFFTNKQAAIDEMIRVAKPGTKIVICDENESGARLYEKTLPGFKGVFKGGRSKVTAPIDLLPPGMLDVKLDNIWNGFMFCLELRKPDRQN